MHAAVSHAVVLGCSASANNTTSIPQWAGDPDFVVIIIIIIRHVPFHEVTADIDNLSFLSVWLAIPLGHNSLLYSNPQTDSV
jgi:hypothetical protein